MAVEGDSSVFQTRVVKYLFSVLANKATWHCVPKSFNYKKNNFLKQQNQRMIMKIMIL